MLVEDEYQVLLKQQWLFTQYEKVLFCIDKIPQENFEQKYGLCFAQALFKGAQIDRRIATKKSLNQALVYHQKALVMRM